MKDELLIRHLLGECDAEEGGKVAQWIALAPTHAARYEALRSAWEMSGNLARPTYRDDDEAWQRFVDRRDAQVHQRPRQTSMTAQWIGIAAIHLLALTVGAWLYMQYIHPTRSLSGRTIATTDVVLNDTLSDGTTVTLNRQSVIHAVPTFFQRKRLVRMNAGEVFFDVKREEKRPFEVAIDKVKIQVLGTSFNVKKTSEVIEVTVASGKVQVAFSGKEILLTANQRVIIIPGKDTLRVDTVKTPLYQHYVSNQFVLKDTPLEDVVAALREVYGQDIVIEDPEVAKLTLTATIVKGPIADAMELIAETLQITITKKADRWLIKK